MKAKRFKKVAIVYDRVNKWGGAERVLLSLLELFPEATLFTSVYDKQGAPWASSFKKIETSFLQNLQFARRNHEYFAPLMPLAFETLNFKDYDLVVSVTSEAAKGIIVPPSIPHVCYCLTPTRYLWSGRKTYITSEFKKFLFSPAFFYLQRWDVVASTRPDNMVAISSEVKDRILKYYKRKSGIVAPPVETQLFSLKKRSPKDYFLLVSRFVKYKKVDLAIKAFNKLPYTLLIVGTGREEKRLKKIAKKNIYFLGNVTDSDLVKLYSEAKALIFPQREDFGIVAVEAQSSGVPVIAYGKGGSLDTVIQGKTGIYFNKQTSESLREAVKIFTETEFSERDIRNHAKNFSKERFLNEFAKMLERS